MGLDPHYAESYDFGVMTSTTYLILNPVSLKLWYEILQELNFNVENFLEQELEIGPLKHHGWTTETLLKLFVASSGFMQTYSCPFETCTFCGTLEAYIARSWIVYLEAVKNSQISAEYRPFGEKSDVNVKV